MIKDINFLHRLCMEEWSYDCLISRHKGKFLLWWHNISVFNQGSMVRVTKPISSSLLLFQFFKIIKTWLTQMNTTFISDAASDVVTPAKYEYE